PASLHGTDLALDLLAIDHRGRFQADGAGPFRSVRRCGEHDVRELPLRTHMHRHTRHAWRQSFRLDDNRALKIAAIQTKVTEREAPLVYRGTRWLIRRFMDHHGVEVGNRSDKSEHILIACAAVAIAFLNEKPILTVPGNTERADGIAVGLSEGV